MVNANEERLVYKKESTYGVNPAGTGKAINFTTNSLNTTNRTTQSNSVRSDRIRAGLIRTGVDIGGEIAIEWQYGEYDEFLEAALGRVFPTTFDTGSAAISYATSDNSFNSSGLFTNAQADQWFVSSGWGVAALNGRFRIVSATANKIIVQGATLHGSDVASASGRRLKGTMTYTGTTAISLTTERQFLYTSPASYYLQTGQRVQQISLNCPTEGIVTGSITLVGGKTIATDSTTSGFSGVTAASSTQFFNSGSSVKAIYLYDPLTLATTALAPITSGITGISFTIATGAEPLQAVSNTTPYLVKNGSISVSGDLSEYFETLSGSQITRKNNFSAFGIALVLEDELGNGYVIDVPKVRLSGGARDNQGVDSAQEVTYNWVSDFDEAFQTTGTANIAITRYGA